MGCPLLPQGFEPLDVLFAIDMLSAAGEERAWLSWRMSINVLISWEGNVKAQQLVEQSF